MSVGIDFEKLLRDGVAKAFHKGIEGSFNYNGELSKAMNDVIRSHDGMIRKLLGDSIAECVNDETFCNDIKAGVRHVMAKTLVQRFGGEIEKQINALKSDPTTRARITLAIEEIVASKTAL